MGIGVLILGASGSGKSTSMRNFQPGECLVLNVEGKPLPFRGKLDTVNNVGYREILNAFKEDGYKRYIIDDSQYLLANDYLKRAKEKGFDKFTDLAVSFKWIVSYVAKKMPNDSIVYFLHHTETSDDGRIKAKTVGKLLDNMITVEGLFAIVLLTQTDGFNHKFVTQSNGLTTAKSPMGMFEKEIDNDLKFVDDTIREYWELGKSKNEKGGLLNGKA